jgi:hypothetical protein
LVSRSLGAGAWSTAPVKSLGAGPASASGAASNTSASSQLRMGLKKFTAAIIRAASPVPIACPVPRFTTTRNTAQPSEDGHALPPQLACPSRKPTLDQPSEPSACLIE